MKVTGIIYPAVQFHLRVKGVNLSISQRMKIAEAIKIPMSGFVAVEFTPRRVIITSTCSKDDQETMCKKYIKTIEKVLE